MVSQELFNQLKQENDLLHKELADLNYLIALREEEIVEIKNATKKIAALQSKLDENLYEFEQLQNEIQTHQFRADGAIKRESLMEEELIESINMEKAYYQMQESQKSNKAALEDLNEKIKEITYLYQELNTLKSKNAALESSLEIATLENNFLKEDLLIINHSNTQDDQDSRYQKRL